MAITKIRIRLRGHTHTVVSHPLLVGMLPANGHIASGDVFAVPDSRFDDLSEKDRRQAFRGTGLRVDYIDDSEDEAETATADEALQAENEALRKRLNEIGAENAHLQTENIRLRQAKEPEPGQDPPAGGAEGEGAGAKENT